MDDKYGAHRWTVNKKQIEAQNKIKNEGNGNSVRKSKAGKVKEKIIC